jgi:hypothetical protein
MFYKYFLGFVRDMVQGARIGHFNIRLESAKVYYTLKRVAVNRFRIYDNTSKYNSY